MSKVLVDRDLLDSAATWLEVHAPGGGCVEGSVAEDLRAILEQPAEAEGPVEMGSDAWMALHLLDRLDVSADEEPRVQQVEEIVRRMGAALSAVTAERDRLQAALSAPDTITAEPAGDYDNLRKQFQSLRMLANSNAKMAHYWRAQCDRETRETLLANAASVNAERDTNSMLTDALETAERERDQLRAEVDALRKDAERYRWLRDPCSGAEHVIYYSRGDYGRGLMSGSMLDAAIDAAGVTVRG